MNPRVEPEVTIKFKRNASLNYTAKNFSLPKPKVRRNYFNDYQVKRLLRIFAESPMPNKHLRETLALEFATPENSIKVWFQNQRAKVRNEKERRAMAEETNESLNDEESTKDIETSVKEPSPSFELATEKREILSRLRNMRQKALPCNKPLKARPIVITTNMLKRKPKKKYLRPPLPPHPTRASSPYSPDFSEQQEVAPILLKLKSIYTHFTDS